ncbi:MAG: 30S ribosomal protein S2 [Patescibacteria group bacterium]
MEEITLQALLEAGCHFGHKAERWHPKAGEFIYTEKDGVHIIDLAKTKAGLEKAASYVEKLASGDGKLLFVGTKRQAKNTVREAAKNVGAPYLVERWIGGFLTNWEQIKKNIAKINRLAEEQQTSAWKKFPKHEQIKLARYLERLKVFYGGVLDLQEPPAALYIVDIKKENAAVREAQRVGIPIVAIVDTNTNPDEVDYPIPANDDAVGSIELITRTIANAFGSGRQMREKEAAQTTLVAPEVETAKIEEEEKSGETKTAKVPPAPKRRGRPKKTA